MNSEVTINSAEYAAFHEAGHIFVAHIVGARVVEAELYRDVTRSWGRVRCERTEEQKPHITTGGFAAEYILYISNRIRKEDGSFPTEKEFIDLAANNASDDRLSFMGLPVGSDADIPKPIDEKFMNAAIFYARKHIDVVKLEALADALLAEEKLSEDRIKAILDS
jgi:hypothetical protein